MTINKAKYEQLGWMLLWLGVSAIAWYLTALKYWALDFHTRDYAFYTEFIIKWSKPAAEQYYTINPGGYNFLGVNAVDGCNGFYQWIHFEPIRFLQAFIYSIFQSLHAVFIFNVLVVCSPLLAMGLWLKKAAVGFWEKIVWVLFFILFPGTLLAAGYDNRPSMFLGIGYFWILYFLLGTNHKWGQYISFLLLFTIREEAMILNGIVCLYMFFNWRKKSVTGGWLLLYVLSLGIYVSILFSYFYYWDYVLWADRDHGFSPLVLMGLLLVLLLFLIFVFIKKKHTLLLFIPLGIFIFQIGSMYLHGTFPDEKFAVQNDPRTMLIMLGALGYLLFRRHKGIKILIYPMIVSIFGFFVFSFYTSKSLYGKIMFWRRQQKQTAFVWKYAENLDYTQRVFTDYNTHQAFLGKPNTLCFERLPCTYEKSIRRFYPQNADQLNELIQADTWMVFNKKRLNANELLLTDKNYMIVNENEDYVTLKITSDHL